ncbi:MAG: TIGR02444 family protein [Betaproteobacteria bacterium]|nr:TIGR02444 family protein [Betaproteobacteria bacterium]
MARAKRRGNPFASRSEHDAGSFWRFSLRTYRKPGVAAACLALQDRCGVDVNLLLYCCWQGRRGRALGKRALRAAMNLVKPWQWNVLRPLRQARRAIGKQDPSLQRLRRRITALELEAERIEQARLEGLESGIRVPTVLVSPPDATRMNLRRFLDLAGVRMTRTRSALLETLVAGGAR